jgi:mRNA interferase RelE/StbE
MSYEIILHPQVNDDIKELSHTQKRLVFKQFKKLMISPELGVFLGNKGGYNLSNCRKMYVDNKKIRIVYRIEEERIVVEVIALGKRDAMEVYKKASQRL